MAESTNDKPVGTPHAHYMPPEAGPFKCATCTHLTFPHFCNHPDVLADAKAGGRGLKVENGKASIHLAGCCNYWRGR